MALEWHSFWALGQALRRFIESLTQEQRQTIRTEIRVKEAEDGGRPLSICVAVRVDAGARSINIYLSQ